MSNISRRKFLKGAGVAALAMAASGVLAGCSGSTGVPDKPTPGVPDKTVHIYYMINVQPVNGEPVEIQAVAIQCHFADIGTQAVDAHAIHLI